MQNGFICFCILFDKIGDLLFEATLYSGVYGNICTLVFKQKTGSYYMFCFISHFLYFMSL